MKWHIETIDLVMIPLERSNNCSFSGVSIDSRNLLKNQAFVAFKGENTDGHEFIQQAIQKGASCVIISDPSYANPMIPHILVKDCLETLIQMAKYIRNQIDIPIIAITGSIGKTTTKFLTHLSLSSQGLCYLSPGNFNNLLGLSISMINHNNQAQYSVYELGMNHKGEISQLTNLLQPTIAIITGAESAHLENFENEAGIAEAKAEILESKRLEYVILNYDNRYYQYFENQASKRSIKILSCSLKEKKDCHLLELSKNSCYYKVKAKLGDTIIKFDFNAPAYFAINALMALSTGCILNLDIKQMAKSIAKFSPLPGRGLLQKLKTKQGINFKIIDDSYNSSPKALKSSLENLHNFGATRIIAIIGDMLELGNESAKIHQQFAKKICDLGIDFVIGVGEFTKYLYDDLPSAKKLGYFKNIRQFNLNFKDLIKENDLLLLKGYP